MDHKILEIKHKETTKIKQKHDACETLQMLQHNHLQTLSLENYHIRHWSPTLGKHTTSWASTKSVKFTITMHLYYGNTVEHGSSVNAKIRTTIQ